MCSHFGDIFPKQPTCETELWQKMTIGWIIQADGPIGTKYGYAKNLLRVVLRILQRYQSMLLLLNEP